MKLPSLEALNAHHARLSFAEFIRQAWPVVEPSTPLLWNWHLDFLAEHVQAVLEGKDRQGPWAQNLIINVPPGTAKSLVSSVFSVAWAWARWPSRRYIFASANPRVSLRDSVRCRELIDSEWYRKTFAIKWQLAEDQNAKGLFKNSAGGFRQAISVGSKVTGDRADGLFIDDPLDASDAFSKAERENVLTWYDQAFANRVNQPDASTRVLIMQRLHTQDLTGHLLEQGGWAHVCLPMEYEPNATGARPTFLGIKDPRTMPGELLFPARFPPQLIEQEKRRLGSAGYAGQMQQRPSAQEGNRFRREWWRFYGTRKHERPRGCSEAPPVALPSVIDEIFQSWDCTFKGGEGSDYVVGIVCARRGADLFVLSRFRGRVSFTQTLEEVRKARREWPTTRRIFVEDKANGPAVISTLAREIPGVIAYSPGTDSKESRAAVVEPLCEAGQIFLPDGADWLEEWVEEFAAFPTGAHDDQVDALSQAVLATRQPSDAWHARALLGMR